MNIIEAVKSGEKIRRAAWKEFKQFHRPEGEFILSKESILADDWEIEQTPIILEMTKEKFLELMEGARFSFVSIIHNDEFKRKVEAEADQLVKPNH